MYLRSALIKEKMSVCSKKNPPLYLSGGFYDRHQYSKAGTYFFLPLLRIFLTSASVTVGPLLPQLLYT